MRVAVVTTSYPARAEDPSGHFVQTEVRALVRDGHVVTLFAPEAAERATEAAITLVALPHWGLFGWPGALERVKRNPFALIGLVPFVNRARRAFAQRGPFDALVAHWIFPAFWPISRDFDGDTTVVAHGSDVRLLERFPAPLQRCILASLSRPNVKVRCVSTELAARLLRLAQRRDHELSRVEVAPSPIEIPSLPEKWELRRELARAEAPLVVVVGRVVPTKRIALALEATHRATGHYPTVIGDGPERARLMARYPEARWLGQLPRAETLRWLKAADVLVSASRLEGAPTVIREARALGTLVVAADAGDLRLWASDDPGLFVVDSRSNDDPVSERDANALARAIQLVLRAAT